MGKFIVNPSLQGIYWLLMFLLFVSAGNIYLTYYYYVKLRNEPGIKGERGDVGEAGEDGNEGMCVINTQCNAIQNCREFLQSELKKISPEYSSVLEKEDQSIALNDNDTEIVEKINNYISILEPKCKSGLYTKEEMITLIESSFN
tara:strand:+ start:4236 stop:4670 length:435 start_codon:yes stop_codon:yes gene_type:complete